MKYKEISYCITMEFGNMDSTEFRITAELEPGDDPVTSGKKLIELACETIGISPMAIAKAEAGEYKDGF